MKKDNLNRLSVDVKLIGDYYQFEVINAQGTYCIEYSTCPEFEHKELLIKGNESVIRVKNPKNNRRLFFRVNDELGHVHMCATRLVDIKSIENFRDIGGYETEEGKMVKWGYFYRCGSLHNVSGRDQEYLESMGIRTLFDLRSKLEVNSNKDIVLANCNYMNHSGISTMDDSFSQGNLDMKMLIMELIQKPEKLGELENFLIDGYKTMSTSTGAFKELFNVLKREEGTPIIFHCTAGKDRTGVSAALILLLLGVDEETVINDYCMSNMYREETNNKQIESIRGYIQDESILQGLKSLLGVKESYLRTSLEGIKEQYDSYEEFFEKSLGVSKKDIEVLREKYLY